MGCTKKNLIVVFLLLACVGCVKVQDRTLRQGVRPKVETPSLPGEADECDIWTDQTTPSRSLLICNDKSALGALYAFDMNGKRVHRTTQMNRPVGVSVRSGIQMKDGSLIDVVGCGVRGTNEIKIFKIDPETRGFVDVTSEKGIPSGFEKDTYGFCLYKRLTDGQLFAFVSRKETDDLHQILLYDEGTGKFQGKIVRKFGRAQQKSFVEGMVADDEYGYLYCSDEQHAILKYYANPAVQKPPFIRAFGLRDGIQGDREGLALYKKGSGQGYLIVSSQGDSTFKIYERAGNNSFVKAVMGYGVTKTDGIAATSFRILPNFPTGIFVAHNDSGNNYALFDWYELTKLR